MSARKQVIIVGGGPAGLIAADILSNGCDVEIFEKESRVGKKFLVAGKGGFNITNSLTGEALVAQYSPSGFMDPALSEFDTEALRHWLAGMGIPTFVGTSGRVFPEKGIRPADVLNLILEKLTRQGVRIHTGYELTGIKEDKLLVFKHQGNGQVVPADYVLLGLGGASWPQTGSNGNWRSIFKDMGIATLPFQPSNCGIQVDWPEVVRTHHTGKPVKNVRLFTDCLSVSGEIVVTEYGLEGNAVYRLVPAIRALLGNSGRASVHIDFKPLNTEKQLLDKFREPFGTKDYGKVFNLTPVQLAVIKGYSTREQFASPERFVRVLKNLEIPVHSLRPVEEAISVVGGVALEELNADFSLKKYPWIYVIGEMADWDAPPGGFLMQGCFSMGHFAASAIMKKLHDCMTARPHDCTTL